MIRVLVENLARQGRLGNLHQILAQFLLCRGIAGVAQRLLGNLQRLAVTGDNGLWVETLVDQLLGLLQQLGG